MRDNLLVKKKKNLKNKFFKFVYKDIKYRLPKIFLENFKDLDDTYRVLNWPKNQSIFYLHMLNITMKFSNIIVPKK